MEPEQIYKICVGGNYSDNRKNVYKFLDAVEKNNSHILFICRSTDKLIAYMYNFEQFDSELSTIECKKKYLRKMFDNFVIISAIYNFTDMNAIMPFVHYRDDNVINKIIVYIKNVIPHNYTNKIGLFSSIIYIGITSIWDEFDKNGVIIEEEYNNAILKA